MTPRHHRSLQHFVPRSLVTAAFALCGCGPLNAPAPAPTPTPSAQTAAITDGDPDPGHPSVGMLKVAGYAGQSTATLVGQRTVLTAAHTLLPGATHTFELDGTTYPVVKALQHKDWDGTKSDLHDIGLLVLGSAPPVVPSIVSSTPPIKGETILLVGYGETSYNANDGGIKRKAINLVKEVQPTTFSYAGTGKGAGNTCVGDSGGPAFRVSGGEETLIGVTSIGQVPCGSLSLDTRVDVYLPWLKAASGGDLYQGDTTPPQVTISSPADGATVERAVTVVVEASDDHGVTEVALALDGASQGRLTAPPYAFDLSLVGPTHELVVTARDQAGNTGQASVRVNVSQPDDPAGCCSVPAGRGAAAGALRLLLAALGLLAAARFSARG